MFLRILLVVIVLLVESGWCASGKTKPSKTEPTAETLIDIDYYPRTAEDSLAGSGSGDGSKDTAITDDEDMAGSGSGSGSILLPFVPDGKLTTTRPVATSSKPPRPLTPCEQLRETSKALVVNYVPRCTPEGHYDSLQCHGFPGTGECWCSDRGGAKIPGTYQNPPQTPDCENGTNLPACIFQLVQFSRNGMLGSFRPQCTTQGEFQKVQCKGSMCYCVEPSGAKIEGTEVHSPDRPTCKVTDQPAKISTTVTTPTTTTELLKVVTIRQDSEYKVPSTDQKPVIDINQPTPEIHTLKPPERTTGTVHMEDNRPGDDDVAQVDVRPNAHDSRDSAASQIMTQPGLLAAIIGGAVVGLLCAVLLVMFIVYRMRKKDEGSYALDEPKRMPNYPYSRAPDKEFYA